MIRWLLLSIGLIGALPTQAEEVTVAVASNFLTTAETLAEAFEAETDHTVTLAHGATGQLYAQAINGAPYDIFLSADAERPERLEGEGRAADRRTYALGRLILVSRIAIDAQTAPETFAGRTVALADPTVAPYGLAATAAMESLGLDTATFRPVLVANVGQVAVVFTSRNADLAFIAASLLSRVDAPHVLDLDGRYPELRQDAVLLSRAGDNAAALAFWDFLASDTALGLIEASGYGRP